MLITFSLLIFIVGYNKAQNDSISNKLVALCKYNGTNIILRWAPTQMTDWYKYYNLPFKLMRKEVSLDYNNFPSEYEVLGLFTPKIKSELEANADSMVQILSSLITPLPLERKGEIFDIQDISEAQETQYGFAMMMSDVYPGVAEALALKYTDKNIKKNVRYFYAICIPGSGLDTVYCSISTDKVFNNLLPPALESKSEEKAILLSWPVVNFQYFYSSYYLEKADNEKGPWRRLSKLPIFGKPIDGKLFIRDSTYINYSPKYYRLIGITPFAELSEAGPITKGEGVDLTGPFHAIDLKAISRNNEPVKLIWKYDEISEDFDRQRVEIASDIDGPYYPVQLDLLSSTQRTYEHIVKQVNILPVYYRIVSIDKVGNESQSFPIKAEIHDNVPPSIPIGLNGKMDKNGILNINWNVPPEPDVMGYRVFYANDLSHEFVPVTGYPITTNSFKDTVLAKSITEYLYVKIVSLDYHFNHSDYSDVLIIKRPDQVPPVKPILFQLNNSKDQTLLNISWVPSTSEDMDHHLLHFRFDHKEWKTLSLSQKPTGDVLIFAIPWVDSASKVEVSIEAIDDDSLSSGISDIIQTNRKLSKINNYIPVLQGSQSKENKTVGLNWNKPIEEVKYYLLLKGVGANQPELYKRLKGDIDQWVEKYSNTEVLNYAVIVIYKNGDESKISNIVHIENTN